MLRAENRVFEEKQRVCVVSRQLCYRSLGLKVKQNPNSLRYLGNIERIYLKDVRFLTQPDIVWMRSRSGKSVSPWYVRWEKTVFQIGIPQCVMGGFSCTVDTAVYTCTKIAWGVHSCTVQLCTEAQALAQLRLWYVRVTTSSLGRKWQRDQRQRTGQEMCWDCENLKS